MAGAALPAAGLRSTDGYNEPLAHRIEAGADIFLMPSRYEPCGLNQMYSLRYGTVPIVRKTGGLADTVEPFDPAAGAGTGFVFDHFTAEGLDWALRYALWLYREDREAWTRMSQRGMERGLLLGPPGPGVRRRLPAAGRLTR